MVSDNPSRGRPPKIVAPTPNNYIIVELAEGQTRVRKHEKHSSGAEMGPKGPAAVSDGIVADGPRPWGSAFRHGSERLIQKTA